MITIPLSVKIIIRDLEHQSDVLGNTNKIINKGEVGLLLNNNLKYPKRGSFWV
jgi:hypothetical protein